MKIPPKTEKWKLDFKLPECPSCHKHSMLLERQHEVPFFRWQCNKCNQEVEYG